MNIHTGKKFHHHTALLLTVCLLLSALAGCGGFAETAGGSRTLAGGSEPADFAESSRTFAGGDSAESDGSSAAPTQAKFDALCREFLREQLEDSYLNLHYSLTDPEAYGIRNYPIRFGDFSLESLRGEQQRQETLRMALNQLSPGDLSENRRLTYRILTEALEAEIPGYGLELYYQPLAPTGGIQAQLPVLMAEFAFRQKQDIDNYLTLLSTIDDYYRQILEFEQEKAAAGLFMTDDCVRQITEECEGYLLPADQNFMTSTFDLRIDAFENLTDAERADYKSRNRALVEEHFIPAYRLLSEGLTKLKDSCTEPRGLCQYPEGKTYYEYLVKSSTGTSWGTIEELHTAISDQIDRDLTAMSRILKEHPELSAAASDYSFAYTDPAEIMEQLAAQTAADFPAAPACHYELKYVPEELSAALSPAFFLVPPIDDYDNCVIYINPAGTSDTQALYTTLAHEGIPGHMYQNTYFLSHCEDDLRKILSFAAYSEGWAFYVENYSYTTDNGLSPGLGELLAHNSAASLGLHALTDININYFGWDKKQVRDFLASYFDVNDNGTVDSIYNAMLNMPVNYLNYYVGYLEILRMRDEAEKALGSRFSLKEFHQFLLDTGPAPFTVIREELQEWLPRQLTE